MCFTLAAEEKKTAEVTLGSMARSMALPCCQYLSRTSIQLQWTALWSLHALGAVQPRQYAVRGVDGEKPAAGAAPPPLLSFLLLKTSLSHRQSFSHSVIQSTTPIYLSLTAQAPSLPHIECAAPAPTSSPTPPQRSDEYQRYYQTPPASGGSEGGRRGRRTRRQ